tara:strand:+ start:33 stop:668 length:636 start_codon:yes stop_codon:yes gene_type:complete
MQKGFLIKKKSNELIKEEDLFDSITGELLVDPVRFESQGKLIPHVVNLSTAKKLKKCPFTQSTNFKIIKADDIDESIEVYKKINKNSYNKILEKIEAEKMKHEIIISSKALEIVEHIVNTILDPKNKYMKPELTYYISNKNDNHGFDDRILKAITNLIDNKEFNLGSTTFLTYKIEYKNKLPDKIIFGKICKCSNCRDRDRALVAFLFTNL